MGALSAGLPMIYLPAGPMLRGNYAGQMLGSGSDAWKYWDERRAGAISEKQWLGVESGIARSYGHCMTMGTASTMTAIADSMGLTLPGASSIPAADANHIRMSSECGRRIVEMVWEDLTPDQIVTPASVRNAATVAMATGCSTNAVVHLLAMARRGRVALTLDDLDALGRTTPLVANVRPSGKGYLMEDFFYAGGLLALMNNIRDKLDLSALTVTGGTLGEAIEGAEVFNDDVIRPLSNPVYHEGSLAVLKGNLAPNGSVIKPAACDPRYHFHEGPAIVFDSYPEMKKFVDDDTAEVTADHVMVLRNAGPLGGPGMPEWGMLPLPKKLVMQGHRDMLRLSDARMSGTSYGACVLHIAPESFVGGPLALLRTGDIVRCDVPNRRIDMAVSESEIADRRANWKQPEPRFERGYGWAFSQHVGQADQGCDFDYLSPEFGRTAGEPDIF
jgi:dihydroxy-acid dehydratase